MTALLVNRVALISGAASGIGRSGARLFAEEGAAVVLFDINPDGAAVANDINAGGGRASFVLGDVSRAEDVSRAVTAASDNYGGLHILWSNAGVPLFKTVVDTSEDEWDRTLAVNLKGSFLMAHYAVPELTRCGGGVVLFTGSTSSFFGSRRWAAYCASKGGLVMLAKAMAIDHARDNIRVNVLCPGSTATPMFETDMRSKEIPYQQALEEEISGQALARLASPDEIAQAALFLVSSSSSFITGASLLVDGGFSAQ
jgi:NAD(P)-dependent dehydrogenase (short-subunit alcohol dehydrogenase family)